MVRGWSARGDAVAIHRYTEATCDRNEVLEIWNVGESAPSHCFAAYSETPQRAIPCREAEGVDPNGPIVDDPKPLALPPGFVDGATSLPANAVLGWTTAPLDEGERSVQLEVQAKGRFFPVDLPEYDPAENGFSPTKLSVWRAPHGRRALVLIEQSQSDDEIAMALVWAKLPRGVHRASATAEPGWADVQEPPQVPDPEDYGGERALAGQVLAKARVYRRLGDNDESIERARAATQIEPRRIDAWVTLSRWLIARGDTDQAWAIIKRVAELPCRSCRVLLRNELAEDDFDAIRDRPGFAAAEGKR